MTAPDQLFQIRPDARSIRAVKTCDVLVAEVSSRIRVQRNHRARRVVVMGGMVLLTIHLLALLLLEFGPRGWHDPEYGRRLSHFKTIQIHSQRHPASANMAQSLVLVLGSSRVAMGVRPDVVNEQGHWLTNGARLGGGPILQLMMLRRYLADGLIPSHVIIEYWPPLLRGDGVYQEERRIDIQQLRAVDEPVIRDYFTCPDDVLRQVRFAQRFPEYGYRQRLLDRFFPEWLPESQRTERAWKNLDKFGWMPGREHASEKERTAARAAVASFYQPLFESYEITPRTDRALREAITLCRGHSIGVSLLMLPEASWFSSVMTINSKAIANQYQRQLVAETGIEFIDGRSWANDDQLPDGFHLTPNGAAAFTQNLALHWRTRRSPE